MIGRKREAAELESLYQSGEAELVAIYGRRRIGKTYLVDEVLRDRITFRHAGLSPTGTEERGLLAAQLTHFYLSLQLHGLRGHKKPSTWLEAFFLLELLLQEKDDGSRQVAFIDELPWLDTKRSGFVTAFEGFWNTWGCHRKNLMVVVCGSANSWILDELINNHGGLYNRVTHEIKLTPFSLAESEELLEETGVSLSRYDIAQSYMILGGIPYYLRYLQRGMSLAQNVDRLFFSRGARLRNEFDRLFASVFKDSHMVERIVRVLAERGTGFVRSEVSARLGVKDGERLGRCLNALVASDFVVRQAPFGEAANARRYKLVDPFCLFYLRFVEMTETSDEEWWLQRTSSAKLASWRGLAFENVCFCHIPQIKAALGVAGVATRQSSWIRKDARGGTQVDLLMLRDDNVANMCEVKFYGSEYALDKDAYQHLLSRRELLAEALPPKYAVHSTLITTFGLAINRYSTGFDNVITLDDLFA